ncbi:tyrosinase, partial [Reticulomyxa filosa]
FENALRRWNLSVAIPYWNWANSSLGGFPDLVTRVNFTDPETQITYKNPWWNYRIPDYTVQRGEAFNPNNTCKYVCRNPQPELFEYTRPNNFPVSFYRQLLQSYEYDNWIVFDFMFSLFKQKKKKKQLINNKLFEIPHNNVHNLIGATILDLLTATFDPLFMLHHMGVERYFLIWQQLTEYRNISYRPNSTQINEYLGCFVEKFHMGDRLMPFNGSSGQNYDPTTSKFGYSSFDTMNWDQMHYSYNPYPEAFFGPFKDVAELANFLHAQKYESERLYLGWYLPDLPFTYRIHYAAKKYGTNTVIVNGSFAKLGSSPTVAGLNKFLFRVDITEAMNSSGLALDNLVEVDVFVTSDKDSNTPAVIIPHPAIIYRSDGQEVFRLFWGPEYFNISTGEDIRIILGSLCACSCQQGLQLIKKTEKQTSVILGNQFSNVLRVDQNELVFTQTTIGNAVNVSVSTLVFNSNVVTQSFYSDEEQVDYGPTILTQEGPNIFQIADLKTQIHIYADQIASQGFHGTIFTNSTAQFRSTELGHVIKKKKCFKNAVVPLDRELLKYDHELYGNVFISYNLEEVDFVSCGNSSLIGCLVNDETSWNDCNVGDQCFGSFPIIDKAGIRYFVANNKTLCEMGMKIAFNAQYVTAVSNATSTACKNLGIPHNARWTSHVIDSAGANVQFGLSLGGKQCEASYWIEGPVDKGWFAVALFGPYHFIGSSATQMQGLSIVATNTGNSWSFALYLLQGSGQHSISELLICDQQVVNGRIRANCSSTLIPERTVPIFADKFLDYMPLNFPKLEPDVSYYYLTAWRNYSDPGLFVFFAKGEGIRYEIKFCWML